MKLSDIRDRFLSFIVPVILVASILGSIIWLVGTTYFWDTSKITLTPPTEETTKISLTIQARIVYADFSVFGFPYSIHFVLPWSYTQTCQKTCIIDRIPAGDATLGVTSGNSDEKRLTLFIAPDTNGTLDLRPDIRVTPVVDPIVLAPFQKNLLSDAEEANFSNIRFSNTVENVYLVDREGETSIYDARTKQVLPFPSIITAEKVGRGDKEGIYLLYSPQSGMVSYDRYGRQGLTYLANMTQSPWIWNWSKNTTTITGTQGTNNLSGIWWPLKDNSITDGHDIMTIAGKS